MAKVLDRILKRLDKIIPERAGEVDERVRNLLQQPEGPDLISGRHALAQEVAPKEFGCKALYAAW